MGSVGRARRALPRDRTASARLGLAGAAIAGMAVFAVLTGGTAAPGRSVSLTAELDRLAPSLGLAIDQVAVTGHRFTPDGDILDALDLANVRSMLAFDAAAARARIERLPWIETARIVRQVPNGLDIEVRERTAYAVWQRGAGEGLIDRTGRWLGAIRSGSVTGLPRVAGEGAAEAAEPLLAALALKAPDLLARLDTAERVGERRWTLHLTDGTRVLLPVETLAGLERLAAAGPVLTRALAGAPGQIDLRAARRIAIRPLRPTLAVRQPIRAGAPPG